MMLALFFSAFGLSLAFCAPPGPITAESLRRGLAGGPAPVLRLQFGALVGSLIWVAVSLAGAAALADTPAARPALDLAGVVLLGRLAWRGLAEACSGRGPSHSRQRAGGDWLAGLSLALANPFALGFWLGAGGLVLGGAALTPPRLLIFLAGFFAGSLLYRAALTALIACGRRCVTAARLRWINAVCGLVLAGFALRLLAKMLAIG